MILDVPYQSQVGNNIYNDCGESCCVMLGAYYGKTFTISEAQDAMERYGMCDTLSQLRDCMNHFNIPCYVNNYLPLPNLTECIREGKPVICLINYGKVPRYAKLDQTYTGGHFVLVIGVDGSVHYHDPLGRADQTVTHEEWNSFYLNQALVPEITLEDEMTDEQVNAIVTGQRRSMTRVMKIAKLYSVKSVVNEQGVKAYSEWKGGKKVRDFGTAEELFEAGWVFADA